MIIGDIRETRGEIVQYTLSKLGEKRLDILLATPPCQGMSKNGKGKILREIRENRRDIQDPRNSLILEAVYVALALDPRFIVFENVPEMIHTQVVIDGQWRGLMDTICDRLKRHGSWKEFEFADYGIPQRRKRLITVFGSTGEEIFPSPTHSNKTDELPRWISIDRALSGIPSLDARDAASARHPEIPLHRVPVLDPIKYNWISHTAEGKSAFDNQCVQEGCLFQGNPVHTNKRDGKGVNRSSKTTIMYCQRCGSLLPRPSVVENGVHRIMSGFTSAYKRMRGDLPANTITCNFIYPCSDSKIHPRENRVLSLYEASRLHTIDQYPYIWERADNKPVRDKMICDIIGESVPPKMLEIIFRRITAYSFSGHGSLSSSEDQTLS
jgi:DNA (cytosine-5)-methyltransferase 1